ncbi:hypothetical protein BKA83DRAFT_4121775 [Pisolithus microcarpus]|nr:hypothetical protein BKA83DRAFT_4121775 [Pisolithus microcarpus]
MYRSIPEKYPAHLNSVLPPILTIANTLRPPLPLRFLPTKLRPHVLIKHVRLALLKPIGGSSTRAPSRWDERGVHRLECFDASQFDGGTCGVELLFAACTRASFLAFSRYPNPGWYLLQLIQHPQQRDPDQRRVQLDIGRGYRNVWTWRTLQRRESEATKSYRGYKSTHFQPSNVRHLPFLTSDIPCLMGS